VEITVCHVPDVKKDGGQFHFLVYNDATAPEGGMMQKGRALVGGEKEIKVGLVGDFDKEFPATRQLQRTSYLLRALIFFYDVRSYNDVRPGMMGAKFNWIKFFEHLRMKPADKLSSVKDEIRALFRFDNPMARMLGGLEESVMAHVDRITMHASALVSDTPLEHPEK
jgi:hypothetical protein